ncbi:MAG: corrinoid protein [Candidatus Methanospirareceae archaeon]
MTEIEGIKKAILDGESIKARELTESALEKGASAMDVLKSALLVAMTEVGEKYQSREFALPEVLLASEAFYSSMELIEPLLKSDSGGGTVVIGTVKWDMHDIGKNLVKAMLTANGFYCYDLGKDVDPEDFARKAKEVNADLVASSTLMTTTMRFQMEIEEALRRYGIRENVKTLVGGAPVSKEWADKIGADGYGKDAIDAVKVAFDLLNEERENER